jgi:hypothetical protein
MTHNLRNVQNFVAALQPNMKIAQFGSYSTLPEYKLAVGKFVAVKASDFNKFQQLPNAARNRFNINPLQSYISISSNKPWNLVRDQGVGGSNPLSPANHFKAMQSRRQVT